MAAARGPQLAKTGEAYRVKGALIAIRKDKQERYVSQGSLVLADALDKENAEHLLTAGLIEVFELPKDEEQSS